MHVSKVSVRQPVFFSQRNPRDRCYRHNLRHYFDDGPGRGRISEHKGENGPTECLDGQELILCCRSQDLVKSWAVDLRMPLELKMKVCASSPIGERRPQNRQTAHVPPFCTAA